MRARWAETTRRRGAFPRYARRFGKRTHRARTHRTTRGGLPPRAKVTQRVRLNHLWGARRARMVEGAGPGIIASRFAMLPPTWRSGNLGSAPGPALIRASALVS